MDYYSVRYGKRLAKEKTEVIGYEAYSLLLACCRRYNNNLIHLYPKECHHNFTEKDYIAFDRELFEIEMRLVIPELVRDYNNNIREPRIDEQFNQYAILDLIDFFSANIKDIREEWNNNTYRDFKVITCYESSQIFFEFRTKINEIFEKAGLLYTLTEDRRVERIVEGSPMTKQMEELFSNVKEPGIKKLLNDAISLHRTPNEDARRDAVEKIWDALERLKTYYEEFDKKKSIEKIVNDMSEGNSYFRELFNTEFEALTKIGNMCRIRHHETDKVEIPNLAYYDYLFNRCVSLIGLAINRLK